MVLLGYYYFLCLLSFNEGNSPFVSGWSFSPFAPRSAEVTTARRRRAETPSSVQKTWQRSDLLFSLSKSRLAQDFTDGGSDDFGQDGEYFDDFSDFDFVVGDGASASLEAENNQNNMQNSEQDSSSSSSPMSVLQQRFQKLILTEQVNRQQISDNWKEGFWGVWGCSLDPYTEENAETKTSVTCLRLMPSTDEDETDDSTLLVVGRSDGSICWLRMDAISSPSSFSSDDDPRNNVENRSVTTYFENKLVAKPTDDGGMVVDKALQRRENENDSGFGTGERSNDAGPANPQLPFEILAQIQTSSSSDAVVDILPLPSAGMLWTISQTTPNVIQGWNLVPNSEFGCLLPSSSLQSSKNDIETIHTSPIVAMKAISKSDGDEEDSEISLVVSVSDNGQVVVWELSATNDESPSSIRIKLEENLLQQEKDYDGNDSVSSIDVDDQYLYLGTQEGKILIYSLSAVTEEETETTEAGPLLSLPVVKSFLGFTSNNPGVSTLLAAGPGTLGTTSNGGGRRPPTKSLIAGDMSGGLKQWELIPAGKGRLEYWPRMATQKLPGGKPHVYETRDYSWQELGEGRSLFFPAIRELLCIQQVLLAATDYDLTVWDSSTGKILYDMQGLDFTISSASHQRPSLIAAKDSVLITNGMENFVCVHDFTMERITSDNVHDFLEQDNRGNSDDDGDTGNGFGND